jgi:hypothetical protein
VIHYRPWEEIHVEFFNAKKDAMKREKYPKLAWVENGYIPKCFDLLLSSQRRTLVQAQP